MDVDFEETNRRQLEHSYTECASRSVRTRLGAWVPTLAKRGLACRARFARRRAVDRAGGVQQFGAAGVGAVADRLKGRGRSVTHGVLRWKGGFGFDKSHVNRRAAG